MSDISTTPAKSYTIVLADDEAFISSAYKEGFERAGFTVTSAGDGEDALAKAKAIVPNIILLDLIMPKLNGFEVLKALQADKTLRTVPVIILSNLSQETDAAEAKSLGAADFIIKSDASLEEVIQRVNALVKKT